MSKSVNLMVLVEGQTEIKFIKEILAPYLGAKNIFLHPTMISKPGQKGGDVKFSRAIKDIENFLKQRDDTYISTFIDYYGLKEWPGLQKASDLSSPRDIAKSINELTLEAVSKKIDTVFFVQKRFIPFVAVHEFEALLFSDISCLAAGINVSEMSIKKILDECGEPESINNNYETSPAKRLLSLYSRYKKTTTGITIAKAIGIEKMREKCPVFNDWLMRLENLVN